MLRIDLYLLRRANSQLKRFCACAGLHSLWTDVINVRIQTRNEESPYVSLRVSERERRRRRRDRERVCVREREEERKKRKNEKGDETQIRGKKGLFKIVFPSRGFFNFLYTHEVE